MRIHRECPVVNQQRSHGWALVMGTSPNLDHGGSWDLQRFEEFLDPEGRSHELL